MHARVGMYAGAADDLDVAAQNFERDSDAVAALDGFEGAFLLIDHANGRAMTITLWSNEDAVAASAERADQIRAQATGPAGVAIESVEVYEVAVQLGPR
ncbi:MAG: hypothetical protein ABR592_05180 [Nitriliruptorales bacterium]